MVKRKHKPDDEEQSKRFIDKALELGAHENPDAFERALQTVKPLKQLGGRGRAISKSSKKG